MCCVVCMHQAVTYRSACRSCELTSSWEEQAKAVPSVNVTGTACSFYTSLKPIFLTCIRAIRSRPLLRQGPQGNHDQTQRKENTEGREIERTLYLSYPRVHTSAGFHVHTLEQTRSTPSNNKQTHEISTNTTTLIASEFNNRAEWKRDQLYMYLWAVCIEPK